jgi:hypothetical protein
MFSEKDLVVRSIEDMSREVDELHLESERLLKDCELAKQNELELRQKSVEIRPYDAEKAEIFWQEAEQLKDDGQEMLRLSMEKKLRAAEVQHQIDIHGQVESLSDYDEVWQKASKAARM